MKPCCKLTFGTSRRLETKDLPSLPRPSVTGAAFLCGHWHASPRDVHLPRTTCRWLKKSSGLKLALLSPVLHLDRDQSAPGSRERLSWTVINRYYGVGQAFPGDRSYKLRVGRRFRPAQLSNAPAAIMLRLLQNSQHFMRISYRLLDSR